MLMRAGNLGNMFLIMIPAICKEKGSPFGSPDICETLGLGYVSLSMAVGVTYQLALQIIYACIVLIPTGTGNIIYHVV